LNRAVYFLAAGLLAGCAQFTAPRPAAPVTDLTSAAVVEHFILEGRVAVRSGEQQYSGGLQWTRARLAETLMLTTPLGQGIAEIRREDGNLVLIDAEGRRQEAPDADILISKVVGAPIPLSGLVYWLSALPRPGIAHAARLDEAGRVTRLEQDGWQIDYDRYQDRGGRQLPGRLFARRGEDLEFRLIVDKWEAQ
jgi:outer membrane lipoprotein LolB